jgi:hypothetical protein
MRAKNLVRKQYLVSEENIRKVEKLATSRGTSAADIVRLAIDAYDPHGAGDMEAPELMELVHEKLREAIATTKKANRKVANALKSLGEENQ